MKNIKVRIIDNNTLEILEPAEKGDTILLTSIDSIDTSFVNEVIETKYRSVLEEELKKAKSSFAIEKELAVAEKEKEQTKKVLELKNQISILKELKDKDIALEKERISKELKEQILKLENEKRELVSTNQIKELQEAAKYNEKIQELENEISQLKLTKSIQSIKNIGESLEATCDSKMRELMENGLNNCTWTKDNDIKKEEDDTKGNKADFIFKIYTDETHSTLLSSICLDMKDEDPSSIKKKKNKDYFEQLEKNRRLKGCEYSVLVSTLESNLNIPMYKVKEYQNMYVVRPEYLISFINLIVSLTNRYKDLLLRKQKEEINLVSKKEFIEEFNKLKETYLDSPLEALKKKVDKIIKQSDTILNSANEIKDQAKSICDNYIETIQKKLDKFSVIDKKLELVN